MPARFRLRTVSALEGEVTMQAALMIPCYIDMLYRRIGIATLELLERLGLDVVDPKDRTFCGRPIANSGCYEEARATEEHCARVIGWFDCVVTPSGSCTPPIRNKFTTGADSPEKQNPVRNTYDLVEFLHVVLKIRAPSRKRLKPITTARPTSATRRLSPSRRPRRKTHYGSIASQLLLAVN
jgi:Fe-S oxidoreductase